MFKSSSEFKTTCPGGIDCFHTVSATKLRPLQLDWCVRMLVCVCLYVCVCQMESISQLGYRPMCVCVCVFGLLFVCRCVCLVLCVCVFWCFGVRLLCGHVVLSLHTGERSSLVLEANCQYE